MIDHLSRKTLEKEIAYCVENDQVILDALRSEILCLKNNTRNIHPRSTTSISLVGTDGGNNQLYFDPFLIQLVRVVDSSNNEYCLEAVSPTTPIDKLDQRHLSKDGLPQTALGEMMKCLHVKSLIDLSPMIRPSDQGKPVSPTWVQVYRELVEWAILFKILNKEFASDTLIIFDGLLRSKVFSKDLFQRLLKEMQIRIESQLTRSKRRVYLAGVAKHSKVLSRYRLVMALEGILQTHYSAYVEVPREIEEKAYIWSEFARGNDIAKEGAEINKFVGGKMFLVKFGKHPRDPIWPVDIFVPQAPEAQNILGCMLADTINGFPVPHYPLCLQKAHANAALVDFDFDILQDSVTKNIRFSLGENSHILDVFQLQDTDPENRRY